MGGAGHEVSGNAIDGNRIGVLVDAIFGDSDRVLAPLVHDPAWTQQVAALLAAGVPAVDHRILDNTLTGNANAGVRMHYHVRGVTVAGNTVTGTGIGRVPDAAEAAFWAETLGQAPATPFETTGSGILLYCFPEENRVTGNDVHDNRAIGILIDIAHRNRVADNRVTGNAHGIVLSSAIGNEVTGNTVSGHAGHGLSVDGWLWMGLGRSDGNRIWLNDLAGNGTDAFDGAGRLLSAEEIAAQIPLMPWPEEMRMVYDNPAIALQMAQMMVAQQQVGATAWDDGTHGNRHGLFDEPAEGFVDRDGDGIGEVPRPIPGGSAVDRFPLSAAGLSAALGR
ncbi:NosD domain-containing protein [Roseicyclus persicicus]|nr:NosD domain-containing protein [Roseibacterium persicicum]